MSRTLRGIIATIIALNLGACAAPQIHLFSEGVTDAELDRVSNTLEGAGYDIVVNTLPLPEDIVGPTLVYSPQASDIQQVENLGDLLMDLGYALNFASAGLGNHFYTEGNLGLYLQAAGANTQPEDSLVDRSYNGQCPDRDAYLHFSSGRFQLEIIDWDEEKQQEAVSELSGLWERQDNTVTLYWQDQSVELFLTPVQYTTQYSTITGIKLVNNSKALNGCSFEYRETVPL